MPLELDPNVINMTNGSAGTVITVYDYVSQHVFDGVRPLSAAQRKLVIDTYYRTQANRTCPAESHG